MYIYENNEVNACTHHLNEVRHTLIIHSEEHGLGMTLVIFEGCHDIYTEKLRKSSPSLSFVPELQVTVIANRTFIISKIQMCFKYNITHEKLLKFWKLRPRD